MYSSVQKTAKIGSTKPHKTNIMAAQNQRRSSAKAAQNQYKPG